MFGGGFQDAFGGLVDLVYTVERSGLGVATQFVVDVDEAAGVDHEVGGIEDPAVRNPGSVLVGGELVVGASQNGLAIQLRDGPLVETAPQGAWGEDVTVDTMDLVLLDGLDAINLDSGLDGGFI